MPPNGFGAMMSAMGKLYNPLLNWFQNHPSPPVAIISDMLWGGCTTSLASSASAASYSLLVVRWHCLLLIPCGVTYQREMIPTMTTL
ncbi:hypothetical protein CsSME_00053813 [Camellia sinensis var. sinensis]